MIGITKEITFHHAVHCTIPTDCRITFPKMMCGPSSDVFIISAGKIKVGTASYPTKWGRRGIPQSGAGEVANKVVAASLNVQPPDEMIRDKGT